MLSGTRKPARGSQISQRSTFEPQRQESRPAFSHLLQELSWRVTA